MSTTSTTLNALPMAAKYPARDLLRVASENDWDTEQIEKTLLAMGNEILRLRDQVAAVSVDKDRQVRAASERALDCVDHGEQIAQLEKQVGHLDDQYRAADKSRATLAVGVLQLSQQFDEMKARAGRGEQIPTAKELIDAMARELKKLSERGRSK